MNNQEFVAIKFANVMEKYEAENFPGYEPKEFHQLESYKQDMAMNIAERLLNEWPELVNSIPELDTDVETEVTSVASDAPVYEGNWDEKADICKDFQIEDFDGEVIYACYDVEYYEGSATVIFKNGDKYYIVDGSHCSCYGLEGQWEPDEIYLDTLQKIADQGQGSKSDAIRKALANI